MEKRGEPDSRTERRGICGVTEIGRTGIEWVCIKDPHGAIYHRRVGDRTHRRGDIVFSNSPKVDAHYFVNKYPNRRNDV